MKKYIIIILLITVASLLQSTTLKRFYYKDYGYVNRLVFVFSSKPQYKILEDKKQIQIELTNVLETKSITTQKDFPTTNKVINSIKFLTNQNNILILINTHPNYYFEKSFLAENGYKIVLDIFKSQEATTEEIHKSYASFYSTVGYHKKARIHLEKAKLLEQQKVEKQTVIKVKAPKDTIQSAKKERNGKMSPQVSKEEKISKGGNEKLPRFYSPKTFIYSGMIILGFILLIWGTIALRSRFTIKDEDDGKDGLGDKEFDINLVIILLEKGWKIPEISREVNLSEKAVKKIKKENKDIIKR